MPPTKVKVETAVTLLSERYKEALVNTQGETLVCCPKLKLYKDAWKNPLPLRLPNRFNAQMSKAFKSVLAHAPIDEEVRKTFPKILDNLTENIQQVVHLNLTQPNHVLKALGTPFSTVAYCYRLMAERELIMHRKLLANICTVTPQELWEATFHHQVLFRILSNQVMRRFALCGILKTEETPTTLATSWFNLLVKKDKDGYDVFVLDEMGPWFATSRWVPGFHQDNIPDCIISTHFGMEKRAGFLLHGYPPGDYHELFQIFPKNLRPPNPCRLIQITLYSGAQEGGGRPYTLSPYHLVLARPRDAQPSHTDLIQSLHTDTPTFLPTFFMPLVHPPETGETIAEKDLFRVAIFLDLMSNASHEEGDSENMPDIAQSYVQFLLKKTNRTLDTHRQVVHDALKERLLKKCPRLPNPDALVLRLKEKKRDKQESFFVMLTQLTHMYTPHWIWYLFHSEHPLAAQMRTHIPFASRGAKSEAFFYIQRFIAGLFIAEIEEEIYAYHASARAKNSSPFSSASYTTDDITGCVPKEQVRERANTL